MLVTEVTNYIPLSQFRTLLNYIKAALNDTVSNFQNFVQKQVNLRLAWCVVCRDALCEQLVYVFPESPLM